MQCHRNEAWPSSLGDMQCHHDLREGVLMRAYTYECVFMLYVTMDEEAMPV